MYQGTIQIKYYKRILSKQKTNEEAYKPIQ